MQSRPSVANVTIPVGWTCEMIVIDNGSTDNTADEVVRLHLPDFKMRYIHEPRKGKGNALNTGFAAAHGEVLLFTDDDVRPNNDWIEQLAKPLFDEEADAVGGRILLAPHLLRPWLTDSQRLWLASYVGWEEERMELIGANMGFRHEILEKVPAMDAELGPGGLGLGEDTLFGWQLREAGLRIKYVPNAVVVHHTETSRLQRFAWLDAARKRGRSQAYLMHHWHHEKVSHPRLNRMWREAKLRLRRILQPPGSPDAEGCPAWEISYVGNIEMCRQFIQERKRPRNYLKHGLKRLDFEPRMNSKAATSFPQAQVEFHAPASES
jgi:cellulose synthase/poly-beta-1,6-N-acetylglucosamine synthase-like glycosyltransferase